MKTIITTFIFSIITLISSAQLSAGDNVYLQFQDTDGEVNVDGNDACEMLKSYVVGKTSLNVVSDKEDSDNLMDNSSDIRDDFVITRTILIMSWFICMMVVTTSLIYIRSKLHY